MVRGWFAYEDTKAILDIDMPDESRNHSWTWLLETSGEFTIRSACKLIKGSLRERGFDPIWKKIWKSTLHPHLKLLWWQLLRDAFLTKGKLSTFMDIGSNMCMLYDNSMETNVAMQKPYGTVQVRESRQGT
ncbi:hypothetical protein F8388_024992 [Cannabis sativa]|uniref:Reverse transcriptase zinc-binding domain-containing protein n=1 Tax=Cannabis sativa TaxID=3483 RepID=A0A7J6G3D5_CANSA|nr:hypothetical protein F8388_024992 [Cannabis sativa]